MDISSLKNCSKLNKEQKNNLINFSKQIRKEIIDVTTSNGGHLSSNLGVVESVLALHSVFNFPVDKLIFDVGHQCYAHKILSNREENFDTIRQNGGLSGFPDCGESDYDCFTVGHAGTSLSSALGMCEARDKLNQDYYVIDFVGDGSLVNGLNLEALTSSSTKPKKFIVVFNDNGMSISLNENAFYRFISRETTKKGYIKGKKAIKKVFKNSFITRFLIRIRDGLKKKLNGGSYFEKFGFKYVGVADGNNPIEMFNILKRVKEISNEKAVLLHIKTTKGKGLKQAEESSEFYHGVGKSLNSAQGDFAITLGNKINSLIENDDKVVAITAGMKNGTGLSIVEEKHCKNFYDVGIAEEYAVTLSAGMAKGGLKPIVAIYSTFMQRAYDQVLHDICLQNLPVIFCLDRAGFVGEDGKTHQGLFDLSFLSEMPNLTILTPVSTFDFEKALDYAISLNGPVAIRYPKNDVENYKLSNYDSGLWQIVKENENASCQISAVGPNMLKNAISVAENYGINANVVAVRSIKPLDKRFLDAKLPIITLEENVLDGGFGSKICMYVQENKLATKVLTIGVKDKFVAHGSIEKQIKENGLDAESIANSIKQFVK